jgi:hypothetical protein
MTRTLARVIVLSAATLCGACGGAQAPQDAPDQSVPIQRVLTAGPWRLVDYRATDPLDPVTQAILAAQIRTMVVTFDGTMMHLQSPSLSLVRPYRIKNPTAYGFDMVSPDPGGAGGLWSHCELAQDGRHMTFLAKTNPWNGTGALEREGP